MRTDDLDYHLPQELIAQTPAAQRDEARLLVLHPAGQRFDHRHISDLPDLLSPGDLLIFNDTRVIPARFHGVREKTGGRIEGLYLGSLGPRTWHVLLKSGGKPAPGERIALGEDHALELLNRRPDGSWEAGLHGPLPTLDLLDRSGAMPLPPYIQRQREANRQWEALDRERYQTVYANQPGAVAAPTAGLHFTHELLQALTARRISIARLTLHVGAGTFAPVRAEDLDAHPMHSEWFSVPAATLRALLEARRQGQRIIAIGTTTVRALESLPESIDLDKDYAAETRLLIQPGFRFRFTDGLLTNFHLPRSTLLALVAARIGLDRLKQAYQIAIEHRYRFYSYGDAMLILP